MPDTAKPVVTFVSGEHWEGLYVNGELLIEGPRVAVWEPLRRLGQACGFVAQIVEPDDLWLDCQRGPPPVLPRLLNEVVPARGDNARSFRLLDRL